MERPCRVILIPNPFPDGKSITTRQPPPAKLAFPVWRRGDIGQIIFCRERCTRADHTGVTEAVYRLDDL